MNHARAVSAVGGGGRDGGGVTTPGLRGHVSHPGVAPLRVNTLWGRSARGWKPVGRARVCGARSHVSREPGVAREGGLPGPRLRPLVRRHACALTGDPHPHLRLRARGRTPTLVRSRASPPPGPRAPERRVPVAAGVPDAEVVGHDEHEVGPGRGGVRACARHAEQEQQRREEGEGRHRPAGRAGRGACQRALACLRRVAAGHRV